MKAADFRHGQPKQAERGAESYLPNLPQSVAEATSEMRVLVERFISDRDALLRFYNVNGSPLQLKRLKEFYEAWLLSLDEFSYEELSVEGSIDWHLLRAKLKYLLTCLEREARLQAEIAPVLPIMDEVASLQEARRQFESVAPAAVSAKLAAMAHALKAAREELNIRHSTAWRAVSRIADLKKTLADWFGFYDGYNPEFSWWCRTPYQSLQSELDAQERFLRETILGCKPGAEEPIVGAPIGIESLMADLAYEMIPYTPDELIAIAETELNWCMTEWRKVAQELGLGADWRAALELVMQDYLAPGEQPALIAFQAYEAIDFILKRDLLTVPPLAIDVWRMSMMSREAQKVSPFFLGGELVQVSFPTEAMGHAEKLDSLSANNMHLARATVQHELIPGHHLQMFMGERYNRHRKAFYTPFWVEGWALWWEFRLWDLGFPASALNRGGMLFWRTHRCARIVFSLNFHLGRWTPDQCIDYLIEQVGHSRHTATGEVRRSFNGTYPPLYQAAYMLGAIQMRALYREFVAEGKMPEKEFHDRILQGNSMPLEMVHALLRNAKLPRDYGTCWRFAR
jgi:hypothetical protein